jgi:tetratricopeptide (TPR) repeat protein
MTDSSSVLPGSAAEPEQTSGPCQSDGIGLVPKTAGDRYDIGEQIARGGMGVVYRATDTILGREVAIKVLQGRFAPESAAARRFLSEARITGQLQHPNIPAIHDVGTLSDGRPFLAMRLVKGRTLDSMIGDRGEGGPNLITAFESACQAVGYAHAHHVVHRDLKPSNIMIGAFGEVQVMDWGLAKIVGAATPAGEPTDADATVAAATAIDSDREADDVTRAGSVLGTPAYMPPEQAIGAIDQIDERSDVFGLGAILCAILTGQPPFVGGNAESTRQLAARAKLDGALLRLDGCQAEPELVALCKRCLSVEKADRPANATEVAQAVAALRAAADERARKAELDRAAAEAEAREQRKRRRVQLALAASVLSLLVAAGAAAWWIQADREARAAAEALERSAAEERVAAAVAEAERHAEARDWPAAVAAARRALDLADAGHIDQTARDRVEARAATLAAEVAAAERDRRLTAALLEASLPEENITSDQDQKVVPRMIDASEPGARFRQIFAEYGVDIDARPDEAATLLAGRPEAVRLEVIAGLDAWGQERRQAGDAAGSARLAALVARLDADPDRRRLRALIASGHFETEFIVNRLADALMPLRRLASPPLGEGQMLLRRMAANPNASHSATPDVLLLSLAIHQAGEPDAALAILQAARHSRPDAPMLAFAEAVLYLKQQPPAWTEAIGALQAARAARPDTGILLAIALFNAKRTTEALAVAEDLRRRRPDNPANLRMLGAMLIVSGRPKEAEAVLREAKRLHPDSGHLHHHLGLALFLQHRDEEAVAELRVAARLRSEDAAVHRALSLTLARLRRWQEAEQAVRQALQHAPNDGELHNQLGAYLYEQQSWRDAEASFRTAIKLLPEVGMHHVNLANAVREQGRHQEAEAAYREGLRLDPDYAAGYRGLSSLLKEQRRWSEVEAILKQAAEHFTSDAETQFQLARFLAGQGRPKDAEDAYRKGLQLRPDDAESRVNLGVALYDQRRWKEAEEVFRATAQQSPSLRNAHYNLGNALIQQRRYREAEAAYREALRLDPDDAATHRMLGHVFGEQRRWPEAEAAFREAIRRQAKQSSFRDLSHMLLEQGRQDEAIAVLRESIHHDPSDPERPYELGTLLLNLGRNAEAEAALQEAIQVEPDLAEAQCNLGHAFRRQGKFVDAAAALRRGHELGARRANWTYGSLQWLREAERLVGLESQLPAVLYFRYRPRDANLFSLLEVCQARGYYVAAAQIAAGSLATDRPVNVVSAGIRESAARSAALAIAGKDADQAQLSIEEWTHLSELANGWLHFAIAFRVQEAQEPKRSADVHRALTHWKQDAALAAIRDSAWLDAMPQPDRERWQAFWVQVDALWSQTKK